MVISNLIQAIVQMLRVQSSIMSDAFITSKRKLSVLVAIILLLSPQLRAVHQNRGTVALVQFDAHTDTYEESSEYDHGGMFYAAPKENLIDPSHSIQIGIRTEHESDPDIRVIDAAKANDMGL
jgi:hypothetical protein